MSPADRPLRIALFTYATQPRGGVAHAIELANALHDLGHDVLLHGLDETGRGFFREPRAPARAIRVAPHANGIVSYVQSRIGAYVAAWDPATPAFDVYHAHDGISGNALATLVASGAIPHFTRTVHHADDFTDATLAALQDRSIRSAQTCLVVSDVWRERVRELFDVAATPVTNGVDLVRFAPLPASERARTRKRFGFTGSPLYLTVGGIEARKNTLGMLEAFAAVRREQPDARLVVAGGASVFDHSTYRRAFAARAETLGLEIGSSVVVLGVVPDVDLPRLLASADALVFPSFTEGFGLVVLEALASGVPVVTSALAPFTEYLDDECAILVDPHDVAALAAGMREAVEAPSRARRIPAGHLVASRYTWAAAAALHVARYEETIDARNALRYSLAR